MHKTYIRADLDADMVFKLFEHLNFAYEQICIAVKCTAVKPEM